MKIVNIMGLHDKSDKSRVVDYLCNSYCSTYDVCCKFDKERGNIFYRGDEYISNSLPSGYLNNSMLLYTDNDSSIKEEVIENELQGRVFSSKNNSTDEVINVGFRDFLSGVSYVISESRSYKDIRQLLMTKECSYMNIGVFKAYDIQDGDMCSINLTKIKTECTKNNITHIAITRIDLLFKLFNFCVYINGAPKLFLGCPLEKIKPNNFTDFPEEVNFFLRFVEIFLDIELVFINFGRDRKMNVCKSIFK